MGLGFQGLLGFRSVGRLGFGVSCPSVLLIGFRTIEQLRNLGVHIVAGAHAVARGGCRILVFWSSSLSRNHR